jgi:hypothetical protein
MMKENYHPNAYLSSIRNNKRGLRARTRILILLDKHPGNAGMFSAEATLPYGVVLHHLLLLMAEGIVERRKGRPYVWVSTGRGQKRLVDLG